MKPICGGSLPSIGVTDAVLDREELAVALVDVVGQAAAKALAGQRQLALDPVAIGLEEDAFAALVAHAPMLTGIGRRDGSSEVIRETACRRGTRGRAQPTRAGTGDRSCADAGARSRARRPAGRPPRRRAPPDRAARG